MTSIVCVDRFPNLKGLLLSRNKLISIVGAGLLSNLEWLDLQENLLHGELDISKRNFPSSLFFLNLSKNKITDITGGGHLTSLQSLDLQYNQIGGNFVISENDFPVNLDELYLGNNSLTGFTGGEILSKLWGLYINSNAFTGDFVITSDNFPQNIVELAMSSNPGLSKISMDDDALPNLFWFYLDDVLVNQVICDRQIQITIAGGVCQ